MPISIKSKTTIESKAIPGVTFVVRTLNKIQRAKRDLPVMATRQHLAGLIREYSPINEIPAEERTPEQAARLGLIEAEYEWLLDQEIYPAVIHAGLVSVDGIEVDGKPATADLLIESAGADYDELIEEIYAACNRAAGLTPAETKNSQSATTSTAPVETDSIVSGATPAVN
jgi:hypothetical protein